MDLAFEIAALILLAFIVVELRALRQELSRLPLVSGRGEEKKTSPTINVNVGTMPATVNERDEESPAPQQVAEVEEAEEVPEPIEEPAPPPPPLEPRNVMATASGLVAVKCPSCGAENSSYRAECFNCGAGLR